LTVYSGSSVRHSCHVLTVTVKCEQSEASGSTKNSNHETDDLDW